jgi:lysophospholipase L1-like esterase
MRIVLLGDSHLARVTRDLPLIGDHVVNAAVGGSTVLDLPGQLELVGLSPEDAWVLSIGGNDASPWRDVSLELFGERLAHFLTSAPAVTRVVMTPPGVLEDRAEDFENAVVDRYRAVLVANAEASGACVVDTPSIIRPLGAKAFTEDGIHLTGKAYDLLLPALRDASS